LILRWSLALAGACLLSILPSTAQTLREARGVPMGQFDFYVLALSWSPGFCEISGSQSRQCDDGSGLGFVTHGLWPQREQGYPTFCEPTGRFVPQAAMAEARGLYPDDKLALYEWRKHGTCSGESPSGYFRAIRQARDLVRIPDSFKDLDNSGAKVLPSEIEQAFMKANPGLRADMVSVSCGRRILQEVRICLDKDLRGFRQCPEVDRDGCRSGEIAVPAVR
jgi:ribonuclease T2